MVFRGFPALRCSRREDGRNGNRYDDEDMKVNDKRQTTDNADLRHVHRGLEGKKWQGNGASSGGRESEIMQIIPVDTSFGFIRFWTLETFEL